jgi:hypothetical protein
MHNVTIRSVREEYARSVKLMTEEDLRANAEAEKSNPLWGNAATRELERRHV